VQICDILERKDHACGEMMMYPAEGRPFDHT